MATTALSVVRDAPESIWHTVSLVTEWLGSGDIIRKSIPVSSRRCINKYLPYNNYVI